MEERIARRETDPPRLRGWIHLVAFFASIVAGTVIVGAALATGHGAAAWSGAVWAIGLSSLFGVSALYHRRRWPPGSARDWIRRVDHAVIFVFIACSYTPFAVLALPADAATPLLATVWAGALAGIGIELVRPVGRRWLRVPLYLALGWVVLPVVGELSHVLGAGPIALLAAGGAAYTLGAIAYAAAWPNPWPRTFGHHELFHSATVVGAALHGAAVWIVAIG